MDMSEYLKTNKTSTAISFLSPPDRLATESLETVAYFGLYKRNTSDLITKNIWG